MYAMEGMERPEKVVSLGVRAIGFYNTTDSSRLHMIAKYMPFQAVPFEHNEVPRLIPIDLIDIANYSNTGEFIYIAEDDGKVIYSDNDVILIKLNSNVYKIFYTPKYKYLFDTFGTKLKRKLKTGDAFKKGDVIFEYHGFENGIPTPGYNMKIMIGTLNFLNFEDAVIVSESFAKKVGWYMYKEYIIPVYVHTKIKKLPKAGEIYKEGDTILEIEENRIYFQAYKNVDMIRTKSSRKSGNNKGFIKKLNKTINDLMKTLEDEKYAIKKSSIVIEDAEEAEIYKVEAIPIRADKLIFWDDDTNKMLEELSKETYLKKYKEVLKGIKENLDTKLSEEKINNKIVKKVFHVSKRNPINILQNKAYLGYILRIIVVSKVRFKPGDKISTMGANKGVSAIVVPDELMPEIKETGEPIDMVISPMATPSRMNINHIYEFWINKLLLWIENKIKSYRDMNSEEIDNVLELLIEIAEMLYRAAPEEDKEYFKIQLNEFLEIKDNIVKKEEFINKIRNGEKIRLFIPSFKEPDAFDIEDIRKLFLKYNIPEHMELVFKPKQLFNHITKRDNEYLPDELILECSVSEMYMLNLKHISKLKMNARATGKYSRTTLLPPRGRKKHGGSRIGNDEVAILFSYDSMPVITEMLKIKADDHINKVRMIHYAELGQSFSIKNMKDTDTVITSILENALNTQGISIEKITKDKKLFKSI